MLSFISYFIIPALTLIFVRDTNWFSTNFSVISIALSRQLEFLLWSTITGMYFFYTIRQIIKYRSRSEDIKKETWLFFAAACLMLLFVLAPYLPSKLPLLSAVHVLSALSCSLFLFFCLLSLTLKGFQNTPGQYRFCVAAIIAAVTFCICAFLLTGIINSAMEICFVITASLLANKLLYLEKQTANKSAL